LGRRGGRYSLMSSGGDEAQQAHLAHLEQEGLHLEHEEMEVPILSLPSHVHKRLKKGGADSKSNSLPPTQPPTPNGKAKAGVA
jgi:hypothetical protein